MLIVSLSGGSGSGKTTLADYIVSGFEPGKVTVLPIDAYYKDHSHLSAEEKLSYNFDHPDVIDFGLLINDIHRLKISLPTDRPIYSFITCSRERESIRVHPSDILIIEGLMGLTHERLRMEADIKVFLDVSEANRLERTIARDVTERGRDRLMVENRFYKTVQPMHAEFIEPFKSKADIVLDANGTDIEAIALKITKEISLRLHLSSSHSF